LIASDERSTTYDKVLGAIAVSQLNLIELFRQIASVFRNGNFHNEILVAKLKK
jgi:hypothetical protein